MTTFIMALNKLFLFEIILDSGMGTVSGKNPFGKQFDSVYRALVIPLLGTNPRKQSKI